MELVDKIYIDGAFVTPHGTELFDLIDPSTEELIGQVRLADAVDAELAIAAAKRAFPAFSRTSREERIDMLHRLAAAIAPREAELGQVMTREYGAPAVFSGFAAPYAASIFTDTAAALKEFAFHRKIGTADVEMVPVGVMAAITPWNANYVFIAGKLATAIAAGCTCVIKPSEMSALQTRALTEGLHEARLPAGVFNIVTGTGPVVGEVLSSHPDISKISFTGSTATGRAILRAASETMKRVTLELGGKGPTIVMADADLSTALPTALMHAWLNNGQACIAGSRLLVPRAREAEIHAALLDAVGFMKSGDPQDPSVMIGPVMNRRQWDRVQSYIALGVEEGATLLTGGPGRPEGIERGWFNRPTIFTGVRNDMRIAREEIFGPVLCVIPYDSEEEAVAIANDTTYGLQAYVLGEDLDKARHIAGQIECGRVLINSAQHDPLVPFGGFKQSGIGRENGIFGIEALTEPRAILV